jgi:hypothetical protein
MSNPMSSRQIKLGAVTMGAGGPGQHFQWLDPEIPGDASVNIGWYRCRRPAEHLPLAAGAAGHLPGRRL